VPKTYDATTKYLLEADPGAWLALAALAPDGPLAIVSPELSTVTAGADGVVRVEAPDPWLVHFEFQSGWDGTLPDRLMRYNVLLGHRDGLPVQSVAVLLSPAAESPALTGVLRRHLPGGRLYHEFHYLVVRAWREPVEALLGGGLGTLPLAPLAAVPREALPGIIRRMEERIGRELTPAQGAEFWTSTYVLMGLKYPGALAERLLQGVRSMENSVTYQAIVAKGLAAGLAAGRIEGERRVLLRQGRARFGPPDAATSAAIEALDDPDRLEALADRLLDASVTDWTELLAPTRGG